MSEAVVAAFVNVHELEYGSAPEDEAGGAVEWLAAAVATAQAVSPV